MLWLIWRQHRVQFLVTAALLAGVGVALLAHGLAAAHFASAQAPPGCPGTTSACGAFQTAMMERYRQMYQVLGWLPAAPAVMGMFWGGPLLSREFERGTHKLVWTQSVTRGHWLAMKLGVLGGVVLACGLALGGMVGAWLAVFRAAGVEEGFSNSGIFTVSGVVPAGWWLFFFALGTAAGGLLRRTLPAMAVTMAVFVLMFFGMIMLRDHYAAPERVVTSQELPADAIQVRSAWVDGAGRTLSADAEAALVRRACPDLSDDEWNGECLYGQGYLRAMDIHRPERFWRFQWTETGILLLGAVVVGAVAVQRTLRRRV